MAFELDRKDVVEIMKTVGMPVSNSTADGWTRSEADTRRKAEMTKEQFDAFTHGLVEWSRKTDGDA